MKLREVDNSVCSGSLLFHAIGSAECGEVGLHKLPVFGLEVDLSPARVKAAVGGRQPHDVGHLVRPLERKGRTSRVRPAALLERCAALVDLSAVRRGGSRNARPAGICRRTAAPRLSLIASPEASSPAATRSCCSAPATARVRYRLRGCTRTRGAAN